ncbi:MAG: lasso peptide biosynthesis B2 protein [Alphaproteobacteria bacterium]|nr:lasso peptide biosynthesis B2 protein [Alphaproteobacteria bacterium]MBU1525970.1 lasso peptide biosynthesis B2 protein [Alphaproteobacteria bacterium]MBU2350378.1 lasso peptide biosynthesis B2 protein [Alphaproteobacteria bacterium]MBU2381612.1 lasso peptide biosynthesis B2 protein [Alphaproteobacteria bacterium]
MRPLILAADRAVWPFVALGRTLPFARALRLDRRAWRRLYLDCLMAGGDPVDGHAWRALYGARHPMPARSTALVLSGLGAPADHELLSDKLELGRRLAAMGIPVPEVRTVCRRGTPPDLAEILEGRGRADLFVKPRHGAGGRNAFPVRKDDDGWRIDGASVDAGTLADRLARLTEGDDLLVQDRLATTDDLADLCCDAGAPVLRVTTSRAEDGRPSLHSAMMVLARPGRNARNFLSGQIYAPVDVEAGTLLGGVILSSPDDLLEAREPGGPRIAGRAVPRFAEAVGLALTATAAVPTLPVVHWDIMLTARGPVVLEGNGAGNWILATLPGRYGLERESLAATLARSAAQGWQGADASRPTPVPRTGSGRPASMVLEAVLGLAVARATLLVRPFRTVARRLGHLTTPDDPRVAAAQVRGTEAEVRVVTDVRWAVAAAARRVPFRAVCLQQALAAEAMLRRRRIATVLHLGSGRDGAGEMTAHAWLDAAGVPVTGYPLAPYLQEVGCFVSCPDPGRESRSAD